MLLPTYYKTVHFILICLLYCSLLTNALPCFSQVTFNKTFDFEGNNGEWGGTVIEAVGGNFLISGDAWIKKNSGWVGVTIYKVDTLGNLTWARSYGDSGHIYNESQVILCDNSNYVLCGQYVNLNQENGGDVLLMKFDENGDTLWMKTYGLSGKTEWSSQVVQTKDKGFAIIGTTYGYGAGGGDYYLIKTDSMGNRQWHKTYGGGGDEIGESIAITQDGGYILGGGADSYGKGFTDGYIIKLDSLWKTQWAKTYGTERDDCGANIIKLSGGNYCIYSCFDTLINLSDYQYSRFVSKIDSSGEIIWRTFLNRKQQHNISTIKELQSRSVIVIFGSIDDDSTGKSFGALAKLDKDGNVLWERKYYTRMDKQNYFRDVLETKDGGFVITGSAHPIDGTGNQDMWLIKLDSMGCLVAGCDTINGVMDLTPNIEASVLVYPNPAKEKAYITYQLNGNFPNPEIKLFDILGKEMSTFSLTQKIGEITLSIDHLYEGVYVIKLISENKVLAVRKLVVVKK